MHIEYATPQQLLTELVARVHDGELTRDDAAWFGGELAAAQSWLGVGDFWKLADH